MERNCYKQMENAQFKIVAFKAQFAPFPAANTFSHFQYKLLHGLECLHYDSWNERTSCQKRYFNSIVRNLTIQF